MRYLNVDELGAGKLLVFLQTSFLIYSSSSNNNKIALLAVAVVMGAFVCPLIITNYFYFPPGPSMTRR
jgi:hypothetical protein